MKKRFLFWIIGVTLMCLVFFKLLPYLGDKGYGCDLHHEIYIQIVKVRVDDKYLDSVNHNHPAINFTDENDQKGTMYFSDQGLYNTLNVGDSLIKEKNSIYYKIKFKTTGTDTIIKFKTDCKDSLKNMR